MNKSEIIQAITEQSKKAGVPFFEMFARVQAAAAKTEHWEVLDQLCTIKADMVGLS